ncbi:tetraacyldisaccharide 4'-kinase [Pasteurellaceae bacterium USgator11]|nr:tetraacyldisaccharide 4'-kinase [Pasteurellaceae bacterium UScroc12]TNG96170.1 tetraacyldisaccharide 4'-kinase [Pasteurellaceae bacterium USgator41]TNG97986.1 tetraacyldisaccharide 4'-kinase [Pasteurellaceae bacterium UScroc31]TNH00155.1 tetraacyldisaccharide 4'-kinase [Pasteurellaceae bacterium USgator11]
MNFWYQKTISAWLLAGLLSPLALLFWGITALRRVAYRFGIFKSWRAPLPVVIVGNLSVGGNGKTPFVIWLARRLQQQGLRVGVISRGYSGEMKQYPQLVCANADTMEVGDESVLIARRSGAKIAICANRRQSIELLCKAYHIDVILSDDGLQHYALQRDIEIVIVDAERRFGNGFLLPAGPLRELTGRLKRVDAVVCNGEQPQPGEIQMRLQGEVAVNLLTQEERLLSDFAEQPIVAMAAIGNPNRFFTTLQRHGLNIVKQKAFIDHAKFSQEKLVSLASPQQILLMTEKDAVKCSKFARENWWYVPVEAVLEPSIEDVVNKIMQKVKKDEH